jgi:ketosteroid isomerase-like protein
LGVDVNEFFFHRNKFREMRNLQKILLLLCILLVTTIIHAQKVSRADSMKLLSEFQMQTAKWMEAYNSKKAENLIPLYGEDAQYVSGHVPGLVSQGRNLVIANFQRGMDSGGHMDSLEVLSMNISCDLATLFCRYRATNSGQTVEGRNLLVLRRRNGVWLIVMHMTVV